MQKERNNYKTYLHFFKNTMSIIIIVLLICELSLIGMELTFFTAGVCTTVAVFQICDWRVLVTHQCFSLWLNNKTHQELFFPCSATPASEAGDSKELGGSTASTTDQRDTPYHNSVLSNNCSRKGGGRHCNICLPRQFLCMLRPGFPETGKTSDCWWEVLRLFLVLLENRS